MWHFIASFILRFRIGLLGAIALLTLVMAFYGQRAEVMQEFVKVVPEDDPDYQAYMAFKAKYGEDGNAVIVGLEAANFFEPAKLNALYQLSEQLSKLQGVERVLDLTHVFNLVRNAREDRLDLLPVMQGPLSTQAQADSLKSLLLTLPFYKGLLFNDKQTTTVLAVSLTRSTLNSKARHELIRQLHNQVNAALLPLGIRTHFTGVPYIRSYISQKLPQELTLFMALAIAVTAVALFAFYRSLYAVIFPLILLGISTVCTFGLIGMLGYKITLITALLPPIIVILGIPSSIYMLSDYHTEFVKYGDKNKALSAMLHRLGLVTFMINANTAFGFITLYFTNVVPLKEFGMLAFLSTLLTYLITIILIPGVFSLLPAPSNRRLQHLNAPFLTRLIQLLVRGVASRRGRGLIYAAAGVLTILSILGIFKLKAISYMLDDLPDRDTLYTDLRYMEDNFKGVMPFEVVVDTRRKGGIRRVSTLRQIEETQQKLENYPELSRTVSIADALKWGRQAFFGGDSSQYRLPSRDELPFLANLGKGTGNKQGGRSILITNLVDSTYSSARISGYVRDIGSVKMPLLLDSVQHDLNTIFQVSDTSASAQARATHFTLTGTTRIFLKANDYLINNLLWSLVATFAIIGLQMLLLFGSFKVMTISLIPNIIPLVVTAGIMGFAGILLKPSTALIYGIAFGIAIDNSIHYLASYRHYRRQGLPIAGAVAASLNSTGMSIIYTSVVLFLGFVIFAPSAFGSTRALGVLTSVTLFIAMFSNLMLLPALLITFHREKEPITPALIDDEEEVEGEPGNLTALPQV